MLQGISWGGYWTFVLLITAGYYLVVYLFYFRAEGFLKKLNPLNISSKERYRITEDEGLQNKEAAEDSLFNACLDELNAFFDNQKKSRAIKREVINSLRMVLQKYPSIEISGYKDCLSNLIATQCQSICSIHLSSDELRDLWLG